MCNNFSYSSIFYLSLISSSFLSFSFLFSPCMSSFQSSSDQSESTGKGCRVDRVQNWKGSPNGLHFLFENGVVVATMVLAMVEVAVLWLVAWAGRTLVLLPQGFWVSTFPAFLLSVSSPSPRLVLGCLYCGLMCMWPLLWVNQISGIRYVWCCTLFFSLSVFLCQLSPLCSLHLAYFLFLFFLFHCSYHLRTN